MAGSEKPWRSLSKYRLIFFVVFLFVIFLFAGAFFFVRSSYFTRSAETLISNLSGKTVEIGSISLLPGRKILIKDVIVQETESHQTFAVLPSTEISVSLSGIMSGRIKAVEFKHPQVTLNLPEKRKEGEQKFAPLPLQLETVTVSEGEVILRTRDDTTFRMTSVDLEMHQVSDHRAALSGSLYLHELDMTIPFTTAIDLQKADIAQGHIDIFFDDLGTLPLQGLTLFRNMTLKGAGRFAIDVDRNDDISLRVEGYVAGLGFEREGKPLQPDSLTGQVRTQLTVHEDYSTAEITVEADFSSPFRETEFSHSVMLKGGYELKKRELNIEKALIQSSQFGNVELAGSIQDIPSANPLLELSAVIKEVPLDNILRSASELLSATPAIGAIQGSAGADVSITGTFKDPHALGTISGTLENMNTDTMYLATVLAKIPFSYSSGTVSVMKANISAAEIGSLSGDQDGTSLFRAENCVLSMSRVDIHDSLTASGAFALNAERAVTYGNGAERFSDTRITLEGLFRGSRRQQMLQVGRISSASGILDGFSGTIEVSLNSPVSIKTVFAGEGIDLNTIVREISFYEKLREISVQGKGSLRFYSEISFPDGVNPRVTGTVDATILDGGFSSPEFTKVAQGITLNSSAAFSFALPLHTVEFSLNVQARGYELLWGRFYGDFKDRDTTLSLRGKYTGKLNAFIVSDSEFTMKNTGTVRISGEIADISGPAIMGLDVVLDNIVNKEVFDFFIRETLQEKYNILSGMAAGGVTSGKFSVKGTKERFAVTGEVNIRDMYITEQGTGFSAQGMSGIIPVDFLYPEAEFKNDTKLFGLMKARSIDVAGVRLEEIEIYPCIWRNALVFRRDIDVPAFGGSIRLRDFRYTDLLNPGRQLTLSLEMVAIDLREMSMALDLPVFGGSLTGFIPEAVLSGQRFSTKGRILIQAFGGEVSIDNLTVNNIFGPVASVETSIGIHDLYLEKLTETFEFGHITGVVRGYVNDLLITNGQAERFEAALESVKKKGVSQWISVEALKKISILGSGTPASVLNQGIYRFFETYQYEKMGFTGTLKNDVLRLLGVEALGDRWYLVKGGLIPPKVDVISYHQNISFQEMLRRLMRVRSMKVKR